MKRSVELGHLSIGNFLPRQAIKWILIGADLFYARTNFICVTQLLLLYLQTVTGVTK